MEKTLADTISLSRLNGTSREVSTLFRTAFLACENNGFSALTVRVEPNCDGEPEINVYGFQTGEILAAPDAEEDHGRFEPADPFGPDAGGDIGDGDDEP